MNRRELLKAAAVAATVPATTTGLRVSCKEDDPGHARFCYYGAFSRRWRVTVDGVEVPRVMTADSGEGYALAQSLDRGKPYAIGDEVATHTVHGVVRIYADGVLLVTGG